MDDEQHRCEVRWLLTLRARSRYDALQHLKEVLCKRGAQAHDRLQRDTLAQWAAGNRGRHGDWRETFKRPDRQAGGEQKPEAKAKAKPEQLVSGGEGATGSSGEGASNC